MYNEPIYTHYPIIYFTISSRTIHTQLLRFQQHDGYGCCISRYSENDTESTMIMHKRQEKTISDIPSLRQVKNLTFSPARSNDARTNGQRPFPNTAGPQTTPTIITRHLGTTNLYTPLPPLISYHFIPNHSCPTDRYGFKKMTVTAVGCLSIKKGDRI